MQMTGNTVLVTGGGSGIGRGLAESLHRLGNQVVIAGRRRELLQAVVAANPGIECMSLDQSDAADVRRFAVELTDRYPEFNVLVNNAGTQRVEDLTASNVGLAEQSIAINLMGPIRLMSTLLPALLRKPRAAILNVTSGLGFMPSALTPTYCATKAALHSYTESLRFQLRDTAVQVIEVIPPHVQTGLQGERGFDPRAMPLDDYIAETMALLQSQPDADEIVVERVKAFRYAERDGTYHDIYPAFNEAITAWLRSRDS
ncbi:SDR family oxidoreductase [Mycobacterium montefiorense]|uniref:Oxidoreductase n=1 Tax=Mycobacterium montefiorense TaxID=154654 RepID=A0AA37PN40_9MYCO|nr:SDR family NAD(P)-dependent oxidoreductase [Mycobacterium montefiorense]GBG37789.1 oxidoreductase [Mycobacterium montefiorense]GKU34927.1 oxidoreductase [Mycobacterium montefiorense]GKU40940.1 oxidoreductase [Mycobacterium montefiorense]GKU47049.1 oxidoreductase [Mycobacterium montefiorense]GKU49169.1 oxidoreductase [Mycobacterium montefiorense]